MNEEKIARGVLARLRQNGLEPDLSELTDSELEALIRGESISKEAMARIRYVPAGRPNLINELTEEEIDAILARHPPLNQRPLFHD